MIRAQPGCCEEVVAMPGGGILPCNKPASKVVDVNRPGSSEGPYLMCVMFADHSVRNRGMKVVAICTPEGKGHSVKRPVDLDLPMSQDGTLLIGDRIAAELRDKVILFVRSNDSIWDVRSRQRVDEGNRAL